MTTFAKKPEVVDAFQFTGGVDSATEVIGWLYTRGFMALYQPPILNDGEEILEELVIVQYGRQLQERFVLRKGYWAVDDPGSQMQPISEKSFARMYEQVDE